MVSLGCWGIIESAFLQSISFARIATSFAEGNFISSVHDEVVRENFI